MTDVLHIGRLRARYRVRGDAALAKERLDAVLGRVLDVALEAALLRLGLPEGEEICVRALRAPARLSLDASDAAVAEAWSEALVLALREAIASGRDVVRFRSRRHALLDLVASAAGGDLARRWAWAQLGLWDGRVEGTARAGEAIADALCALPDAAPAAVAEAARRGVLPALAARLPERAWDRVAGAALEAFGTDAAVLEPAPTPPGGPARTAPSRDAFRRAARIAARSPIAAALRGLGSSAAAARRPLLALAALDAEPEALRRPRAEAVLTELERATGPAAPSSTAGGSPRQAEPRPSVGRPGAQSPTAAPAAAPVGGPERPSAADAESLAAPPVEARATGRTRAGGLLYLLHVVAELGLPETLCAADGPLAGRSLRFGLHALALALLPIEPRDAAALAFCGLGPDDAPPSDGEDPTTDAERDALEAAAAAVSERLRARVGRAAEPARAVLLETCRRDAEVLADPAWLEVRFSIDDVDVRVRRAGLDLDPGWLPWIGCVVRFVYA